MAAKLTGLRPEHDTWPAAGVGGVRGIGEAPQFIAGGYGSAGCSGCMPLGCFEMTTVPPQSPNFFASAPTKDLLALAPAKSIEDPSPKSMTDYDFEAELQEEKEVRADQAAWQPDLHTD
ncbi:hypothetical protein ABPG77_004875 [Micractinium sp. CCAP 211/92]